MHTIAKSLSASLGETVSPSQIHDFELSLFDVQPATIGGALDEFIFSPRLDNLFSSFAAVSALCASVEDPNWGHDGRVAMIALWDNEEVGSVSAYGAESNFIESVLERVAVGLKKEDESATEAYQRTLAKSFMLRYASDILSAREHVLIGCSYAAPTWATRCTPPSWTSTKRCTALSSTPALPSKVSRIRPR